MKELLGPNDIIRSGMCIGCGSCVAQNASSNAAMQFDAYGELKPKGAPQWLQAASEKFTRTCPFSPAAANEDQIAAELFPEAVQQHSTTGRMQSAFVGYVAEEDFRMQGSSGGMVSWVAAELLRKGLVDGVAHVVATEDPQNEDRFFKYRISKTISELQAGAKSRYYPVELSEILQTIRERPGRYAVVGIPCFIKAVQLLRREDALYRERIRYTLGLFCGHMKSARFVESFAWQLKVPVQAIRQVEFRYKNPGRPANWYTAMLTLRDGRVVQKDWWHLVDGDWGAGFFMNHACNFCDDVVAETADVAFGDAWVEPYSSDGRGTNVVVVRSPEMEQLIGDALEQGRLKLEVVDAGFVEQTQAAGFRQRREGLAYRLVWAHRGVQPVKRVAPDAQKQAKPRKRIYRMRYLISQWSHRVFWLARRLGLPQVYIGWARLALSFYHGWAHHQGKWTEMIKRFKGLKQ